MGKVFEITDGGDRHPNKRGDHVGNGGEKCGAPTRASWGDREPGRPCGLAAGHGTPNRSGPCYLHFGRSPQQMELARRADQQKAATKELQKLDLWGARRDELSPVDALGEELSRTAGRVLAIEQRLQQLPDDQHDSPKGRGLADSLTAERGQLQRVAEAAERAGVTVKRQERQLVEGDQLAAALRGLFIDLELTATQQMALPDLVRWHLRGQPQDVDRPARPSALYPADQPQPAPPARPIEPTAPVAGRADTPATNRPPDHKPLSETDELRRLRAAVERNNQRRSQ